MRRGQEVHHDDDRSRGARSPANRLGLDYRAVPPRKVATPLIDIHAHVHAGAGVGPFFEAAALYGVAKVVSMTPLDEVESLRRAHGDQLAFIAVPRWRRMAVSGEFQRQWLADLEAFHALGARRMKFWVAPPMRGQYGLTLDDPFFAPLVEKGLGLGYDFMVHVGDPSEWFEPGGRYADARKFGSKREQYPPLERFLDTVAPRNVIGAHMGGYCEDPDFLQGLLDRHDNFYLDSSATKWIVRAVARQPEHVREFIIRNQDRILFGSDLVVEAGYGFEHYASRYWAHLMMWETACRGESPIEDPDADDPPRLAGVDLPAEVLRKMYRENAVRLGY
jgi:predicted TIM-barrel fold metal-dependent hydrolase